MYSITHDGPAKFLRSCKDAVCSEFYVEFLRLDPDLPDSSDEQAQGIQNHAVIKIDFSEPTGGHNGVRLYMCMLQEFRTGSTGQVFRQGALFADLVAWRGRSNSSLRSFQLRCEEDLKLSDVINALTGKRMQMQRFEFTERGGRYFGCRDFVTQAIYHLESIGYVGPEIVKAIPPTPVLAGKSIYDALGMQFNNLLPAGFEVRPLYEGHFKVADRVKTQDMPYAGSEAADALAQKVAEWAKLDEQAENSAASA